MILKWTVAKSLDETTWLSGPYVLKRYEHNVGSRKTRVTLIVDGKALSSYCSLADAKAAANKLANNDA